MVVLYRNTRHRRVRGLQYGFWAAAVALGGLALPSILQDADTLALRILAPIMVAFALAMELYRGLYVTRVTAVEAGMEVESLGFLGRRQRVLPWAGIEAPGSSPRRYQVRGDVSTAIMLRRPGAWLPYVVDTTADAFDRDALAALLRRRSRPS